jgi:hypothetical protein
MGGGYRPPARVAAIAGRSDLEPAAATERAARVRDLESEERHEGGRWVTKDDMLGLVNDVW